MKRPILYIILKSGTIGTFCCNSQIPFSVINLVSKHRETPWIYFLLLVWISLSVVSLLCKHAKLFQSCPTLCDPMDSSPPGSSVHRILQARTLEWVAIPFSIVSLKDTNNFVEFLLYLVERFLVGCFFFFFYTWEFPTHFFIRFLAVGQESSTFLYYSIP